MDSKKRAVQDSIRGLDASAIGGHSSGQTRSQERRTNVVKRRQVSFRTLLGDVLPGRNPLSRRTGGTVHRWGVRACGESAGANPTLVVDGSRDCLPKRTWKFGAAQTIRLKVLPPVDTAAMTMQDVPKLRDEVRGMIVRQVAEWRGVDCREVDGIGKSAAS